MGCRLDFLSYEYGSDTARVESDGELTVEFAEMERFANLAATTNTVNDYWCALAARPELFCLDIAAPSTLSNSLNTTSFDLMSDTVFSNGGFILDVYQTVDNSSLNLFGQYDQCDGKTVGDGLINVFDIATLIAYIFKDYRYADLDTNPEQVITVEGRDRLQNQCDALVTRVEYLSSYATDTCVYFDDGCHGTMRWASGCGNPTANGMNSQTHPYNSDLSRQTKREICASECERRSCVNFEIEDTQCVTYMAECTDAGSTTDDLEEVYTATYSCDHDYLPSPPPPTENAGRRLQPLEQVPVTAQSLWSRWQSMPLSTSTEAHVNMRSWLPAVAIRHDITSVPARQLAVAQHTLYPDYDHENGRWYTLRTASVSVRLHAVLNGVPGAQINTKLSNRRYDGSPPQDPSQQEIRYTRFCEFGQCESTCASIETAHPSRIAMHYNTLELLQRPIARACPFETHIWVPYHSTDNDRCVGLEYLMIGDGVRGQFARDTACTRNVIPPPPPTPLYVGTPRLPPPPQPPPVPVVSYTPPSPPNASLSFPPPPSADPPSVDKSWVWIVSITILVLGCGCCCMALAITYRRRDDDERDDDVVRNTAELRGGVAPTITRASGLGSSNTNPIKPRSDGHMMERRGLETVVAPAPVQRNRYPVLSDLDGTGLGARHIPKSIEATTVQVNRYSDHSAPSSSFDGTGLGRRRRPPPAIGEVTRVPVRRTPSMERDEAEDKLRI